MSEKKKSELEIGRFIRLKNWCIGKDCEGIIIDINNTKGLYLVEIRFHRHSLWVKRSDFVLHKIRNR